MQYKDEVKFVIWDSRLTVFDFPKENRIFRHKIFSSYIKNQMSNKTNPTNDPKGQNIDHNNDNDTEFPGYPHYPAKEDIMRSTENERVDLDVENLSRSNNLTSTPLPDQSVQVPQVEALRPALGDLDDVVKIVPGTEADVTKEDLLILGEKDGDFGRTEEYTGEELDVPGSEQDDADEEIGEEDEENNYYSLGGDAHENLEEDQAGEQF